MSEKIDIRKLRLEKKTPEINRGKSNNNINVWDFLNKDIRLWKAGLPDKIKEDFYMELRSLLGAGVDIRTALELIRDEQKKKKIKLAFENLLHQIIEGSTLSAALKKTKQFSSYEFYSIQIGEETGKLQSVLTDLTTYFNKKIKQKRQLIGAITYPIVVLVVAFAAVFFMITYVVPMFSDTFKRFGNDLPAITKIVIASAAFLKKFMGLFVLLFISLILLSIWHNKKSWFRKISSALVLKIPIVGSIVRKIYLSRFANTMALLAGSKIPMVQAIQLTRQMITFYPIESSLHKVEEDIMSGTFLYKSLAEHSVYPPKMISIIKVAEEVNQLDFFFKQLAEQYSNEIEHQTNLLSKFLEPLIIVVLGLVVGVILIAMYLPLFKLGQGF